MGFVSWLYLFLEELSWLQKLLCFAFFRLIRLIYKFIKCLLQQCEGKKVCMASPYMKLTKSDAKFADGTYKCLLQMFDEQGEVRASWTVCTGQGWAQVFRKAGRNVPGSMEPLPQGSYYVHDIDWAGGKDNWNASHGAGIGPVFISVVCAEEKRRGDFGIHMDFNRTTSPGTAGCLGVIGESDMRDLVTWLRKLDPRELKVDWGL